MKNIMRLLLIAVACQHAMYSSVKKLKRGNSCISFLFFVGKFIQLIELLVTKFWYVLDIQICSLSKKDLLYSCCLLFFARLQLKLKVNFSIGMALCVDFLENP